MRYFILSAVFLILCASGCKKRKDAPLTSMTTIVDGDTVWTTTNVITENTGDGTVYITGNNGTSSRISLAISGFIPGKKIYYIDYRGAGGNINGNVGSYSDGTNLSYGQTGDIYVTSVANNTITGSFDLYTAVHTVKGYFTAAER